MSTISQTPSQISTPAAETLHPEKIFVSDLITGWVATQAALAAAPPSFAGAIIDELHKKPFVEADANNGRGVIDGKITKDEANSRGLGWVDPNGDGYMSLPEFLNADPFTRADGLNPDHVDGLINDKEANALGLRYFDPDGNGVMDGGEYDTAKNSLSQKDVLKDVLLDDFYFDPDRKGFMTKPEYVGLLFATHGRGLSHNTFRYDEDCRKIGDFIDANKEFVHLVSDVLKDCTPREIREKTMYFISASRGGLITKEEYSDPQFVKAFFSSLPPGLNPSLNLA